MVCHICGTVNEETAKYCRNCGALLHQGTQAGTDNNSSDRYSSNSGNYTYGNYGNSGTNGGGNQSGGQNDYQGYDQNYNQSYYQNYNQNYGQNYGQGYGPDGVYDPFRREKGKGFCMAARVAAIICAVLFIIAALADLLMLSNVLWFLRSGYPLAALFLFIYTAAFVLGNAALAAGLAVFGICLDRKRYNTDALMTTVIGAGLLRIVLVLIANISLAISYILRYQHLYFYTEDILFGILWVIIAGGILYLLLWAAGSRPYAGMTFSQFKEMLSVLPDTVMAEISAFRNRHGSQGNGTYGSNGYGTNGGAGYGQAGGPMKENRSIVAYWLLGLITCGIYQLYVIYTLGRDINIIGEGDGSPKPTTGLVKYIVFSLITCGIYSLYWFYKLARRIEQNEYRYQVPVKTFGNMELGPCWLVLRILGGLISGCGVGLVLVIYGDYLLLSNMNELSKAYNYRNYGGGSYGGYGSYGSSNGYGGYNNGGYNNGGYNNGGYNNGGYNNGGYNNGGY